MTNVLFKYHEIIHHTFKTDFTSYLTFMIILHESVRILLGYLSSIAHWLLALESLNQFWVTDTSSGIQSCRREPRHFPVGDRTRTRSHLVVLERGRIDPDGRLGWHLATAYGAEWAYLWVPQWNASLISLLWNFQSADISRPYLIIQIRNNCSGHSVQTGVCLENTWSINPKSANQYAETTSASVLDTSRLYEPHRPCQFRRGEN